jgi:hypothetical protein
MLPIDRVIPLGLVVTELVINVNSTPIQENLDRSR